MDQKIVDKLEEEFEQAIADVVVRRLGPQALPFVPPRSTMHLMAKAAVAVYEAAEENHGRKPLD